MKNQPLLIELSSNKKTNYNKANTCIMAVFELQDAADISDSLKKENDPNRIRLLLKKIKSNVEYFDLYGQYCKCFEKIEDVIFLYSPEDKVDKALQSKSSIELRKLISEISDDIDFLWIVAIDCTK